MLKRTWLLIKESPEYLGVLIIVTCFSLGVVIGEFLKDGGYL
mgnify:CR=1 FL=1